MRSLTVPHYECLTLKKIWLFATQHPEIYQYMPDPEDREDLPRSWIVNVFYTVLGKGFSKWVEAQLEARNQERAKEQDTEAQMLPKFYQAFKASTDVSGKFLYSM